MDINTRPPRFCRLQRKPYTALVRHGGADGVVAGVVGVVGALATNNDEEGK
jgi:hypothetical protein